ncbi:hypothetical protein RFH42_02255 [Acinetobacter rudis]|uniref:hypothetical protein n=1 Tax=Acinetobacter rudis TaxID=632955 RepID=UPI00280FE3DD|nr:hypothetical protein [Acinetobacter rudis]MDQ8951781.1 hypothetical protein [Acinetobacter rudis]
MKRLWVVICGNIRDILDFKLTLSKCVMLRNEGKINQIVFSTWIGEIDRYEDLRNILESLNIYVIENNIIKEDLQSAATLSVNFWRQSRQLHAALDVIPKEDFILRVRTDRSINYINQMERLNIFDQYDIPVKELGKFPKIFDSKITVFGPKTVRLLHMLDFTILGKNRDLSKLINFEVNELFYHKPIVANAQWYQNPFLKEFPILRQYQELSLFTNKIKILKEYVNKNKNLSFFPEIDYKVYSLYVMILHTHFNIMYMGELKKREDKPMSFYNLFTNYGDGLISTVLGSSIRDQKILDDMINGKMTKDLSYDKFMYYIRKLISDGVTAEFNMSYSDYMEVWNLNKNKFYGTDVKWFKPLENGPLNPSRFVNHGECDFNHLRQLNVNSQDWLALVNSIKIESDLFKIWKQNLNNIEESELMLMSPAKTGNIYAIFVLLRLWISERLKPINFDEVKRLTLFYINYYVNRSIDSLLMKRIIILFYIISIKFSYSEFKLKKYLSYSFGNDFNNINIDDLNFNMHSIIYIKNKLKDMVESEKILVKLFLYDLGEKNYYKSLKDFISSNMKSDDLITLEV